MLLIIFLGIIAKLALFSGDHVVRTGEVKECDFCKVGINVMIRVPEQAAFKTAACVYISLLIPLTNSQLSLLKCARLSN